MRYFIKTHPSYAGTTVSAGWFESGSSMCSGITTNNEEMWAFRDIVPAEDSETVFYETWEEFIERAGGYAVGFKEKLIAHLI